MEFIISKGSKLLPNEKQKMEDESWFNMWTKRNFPYKLLIEGDILYWLDTTKKQLVWKTEVLEVDRYPYNDKSEIWEKYKTSMSQKYYDDRPDRGYFLYYRIKVLEKINIAKPNYSFDQLGWEELDDDNKRRWFPQVTFAEETLFDKSIEPNERSLMDDLRKLNQKMQFVDPKRIEKLMSVTIRKDTAFINKLKEIAAYTCQFPNCGHQIKTGKGKYYIEVAHIKPVNQKGKSVLGNLLVLCPNHHKEFDYGELQIKEQTLEKLSGSLNGIDFTMHFDFMNKNL
jgi:predicted restriction endonuclease